MINRLPTPHLFLAAIFSLLVALMLGGCQSAQGIASAGSGAVATITDDLNQAHTVLDSPTPDAKTADAHVTHAQGQLPAVAAMPAEITKLNDRWNGSYLAGKGTFWFWLIVIVLIGGTVLSVCAHTVAAMLDPTGAATGLAGDAAVVFSWIGHAAGIVGGWLGAIVNRVVSFMALRAATAAPPAPTPIQGITATLQPKQT